MNSPALRLTCLLTLAAAGCPTGGTTGTGHSIPLADAAVVETADAAVARPDAGGRADAATPVQCESHDDCPAIGNDAQTCVQGACVACEPGERDCRCLQNGRCGTDLRCAVDDTCIPCVSGVEGCPCTAGGACGDGLACSAGVCVTDSCEAGRTDCPCGADGACTSAPDAYCDGMGVCRACSEDVTGCPCGAGGTCGGDRICESGTCADCPATDRPVGCGCSASAPCAAGVVCDQGMCRPPLTCEDACLAHQLCDTTLAGDPYCVPSMCEDGFIWNGASCEEWIPPSCDGREGTASIAADCEAQEKLCVETAAGARCLATCATLAATCAQEHRDCAPGGTQEDARCGACTPGYRDASGVCESVAQANCVVGAPDSIVAECDARLRACVPVDGGGAVCGACRAGSRLDDSGNRCIPEESCAGGLCVDGEICVYPQSGGLPRCEAPVCGAGEARDPVSGSCTPCSLDCGGRPLWPDLVDGACACRDDIYCDFNSDGASPRCHRSACAPGQAVTPGGECVSCPIVCGDTEGETPRLWPTTTLDGSCVCETAPGYYVPLGGSAVPQQCDGDQDGWLNRTAGSTAPLQDPATQANFRCQLRRIDRFVLRNELGQEMYLSLCEDNSLKSWAPGDDPPCDPVILALQEPDVLDEESRVSADDTLFPAYGDRKLTAAELNPLTRACVSLTGDFNLNGREDVLDEQPVAWGRLPQLRFSGPEDFAFQSLSYFTELHVGYYQPSPSSEGLPGRYIIRERSRCDASFPLGYLTGGEYWRSCTRRRRGDYNFNAGLLGQDFAAFSCAAEVGSCPVLPPPLPATPVDGDGDGIADHGLCNVAGPPADGIWRGMNHHSQFQCVVLRETAADPWELSRDEIYDTTTADAPPRFEFNRCSAVQCSGTGCAGGMSEGALQPRVPAVECTPTPRSLTSAEQVGFVAVRYVGEGGTSTVRPNYLRGCISEAYNEEQPEGWKFMCGGGNGNAAGVLHAENQGDFGAIICGCGRYTGGLACDVPCAERALPPGSELAPSVLLHAGAPDYGYDAETSAAYGCSTSDGYCQLHPAVPEEGFLGGARGIWMCADFAASRPVSADGDPVLRGMGLVGGTERSVAVQGGVRLNPVHRVPLQQAGCNPETEQCYAVW